MIRPFYDFDFDSWAAPGERLVTSKGTIRDAYDTTIHLLANGSAAALTLPTPAGGPPLEKDDEIADAAVEVTMRLLRRQTAAVIDGERQLLHPEDIGVCATHRVMNAAMQLRLPSGPAGSIRVDTPERWQGLERRSWLSFIR